MKSLFAGLLAGIAAMALAVSASAQSAAAGARLGQGPGAKPLDCATAKDKARCEGINDDIAACKGKTDDDWRACMHRLDTVRFAPPRARDCSKSHNRVRCDAHTQALEACKDKATRAEHRQCVLAQLSV